MTGQKKELGRGREGREKSLNNEVFFFKPGIALEEGGGGGGDDLFSPLPLFIRLPDDFAGKNEEFGSDGEIRAGSAAESARGLRRLGLGLSDICVPMLTFIY